jgi:hypothetical protein
MMNYESTLKTGIILNKLGLSCAKFRVSLVGQLGKLSKPG